MKIKSFLICTALYAMLIASTFANTRPSIDVRGTINEFAESYRKTDAKSMERILSFDASMKFSRGNELYSYNQESILKLMKQNQGVIQNCTTRIDLIASSDAMAIAKVNFVYADYVIEHYLSLELNGKSWKITRINKFFNDSNASNVLTKD